MIVITSTVKICVTVRHPFMWPHSDLYDELERRLWEIPRIASVQSFADMTGHLVFFEHDQSTPVYDVVQWAEQCFNEYFASKG